MHPVGSLWREWASPLFRFLFLILLLLRSSRPKHNASIACCCLFGFYSTFQPQRHKMFKSEWDKNKLVLSSYRCILNLWCVLIALQYILVFFKSWFGTRRKNCLRAQHCQWETVSCHNFDRLSQLCCVIQKSCRSWLKSILKDSCKWCDLGSDCICLSVLLGV